MAKAKFHPVTEIIPRMLDEEFQALKADIEANGLLEPIWRLPDGQIIDGRHRHRACAELGVEPEFTEAPDLGEGELLAVVVALNLRRRHLTVNQRGMVGARLKPLFAEAAKRRKAVAGRSSAPGRKKDPEKVPDLSKGDARDKAAESVHVSGKTVDHSERVLKEGIPELVAAVDSGEIAVSDAAQAAGKPKQEQATILKRIQSGTARNVKDAVRKIRLAKQIELVNKTPPPKGKFNVIAADPPWRYEKTREDDPTQRGKTPYPTMTVEEICAVKVPADTDCTLWLWCTNAMLADGSVSKVLERWGFTGKTILTWAKNKMGLGDWLRGKTEHCVVASKGHPVHGQPGSDTTLLEAPVGEHSEKPDAFFALVERLCPGRKLEMFSRKPRKGWAAWGSEA